MVLIDKYGLMGVAIAFAATYLSKFIIYYGCSIWQIKFSFWPRNILLIGSSLLALIVLWIAGERLSPVMNIIALALVLGIWLIFSVRKRELIQLKQYAGETIAKLVARRNS
jgi:O-antigen/teichoic acid export membrane protein